MTVSGRAWRLFADQDGATAIEYCLVASLVSIVILTSVQLIGLDVTKLISSVVVGLK